MVYERFMVSNFPDTSPLSRTGKLGLPMTSPKAAWRKIKLNKNNKFMFKFK